VAPLLVPVAESVFVAVSGLFRFAMML